MAYNAEKNGFAVYRPQATSRLASELDWIAMTQEPNGYKDLRLSLSKRTFKQLSAIDTNATRFAVAMDKIGRVAVFPDVAGYSVAKTKTRATVKCDNMREQYTKALGMGFRRLYVDAELSDGGDALILTPTDRWEE